MVRRMARPLVCIPTYNEASNILPLVELVHEAAPDADVLVIDDASPDGTGDLVRDRMLKDARLELMARPTKLGLGTAYMAGFAFGLQHGYDSGLTIVEVPITVTDRRAGQSKISRQEILRAMLTVLRLAGRG